MAFGFTPIYVSTLGIEAYGVIGTFAALQVILGVFDLGMGLTLNRQLARLATDEQNNAQRMRDSVRTFEMVYWAVGIFAGSAIVLSATAVASLWFRSSELSAHQLSNALVLLGVALAVQWPSALYLGGLLGLQRQLSANVILTIAALVRGVGAVAVLSLASPTLEAFFVWQVVASLLQTLVLRVRLSQVLPPETSGGRFRVEVLRANISFAADLTGITVLATLLTQLDKVVLSGLVSLKEFGYYVLAGMLASSVYLGAGPVFNAAFPRLVAASATGEAVSTRRTYHEACQLTSVLVLPPSLVLIAFAPEALYVWLGTAPSDATVWLVRILAAGTALNALMTIPGALMLASGWTKLPLFINTASVLLLVPLIVYMASRFGTVGGALGWLLLNAGYVSLGIAAMHRRLLPGQAGVWYWSDVGLPLLGAVVSVMIFRVIIAFGGGRTETAIVLILCVTVAVFGSALASGFVRSLVRSRIRTRTTAS